MRYLETIEKLALHDLERSLTFIYVYWA